MRQKTTSVKVILDKRRKTSKGKWPVRLRVTHDRVQRYYPLPDSFTEQEWDAIHNAKMKGEKYYELQAIEQKATNIISKMGSFSFDEFEKRRDNYQDTTTLTGAFNSYITELRNEGRIGSAIGSECARNSLDKFKPGMLLNDITVELLKKYESYMLANGASTTTVGMYLRGLRVIVNRAIAAGEFKQENYPFGRHRFQIPTARKVKKVLNASELKKIYNLKLSGKVAESRDYWMFMYFAHGMNAYDLCLLKRENIQGEWIVFRRRKTIRTNRSADEIRVPYTADLKRIVKKYGQLNGSYIFNILRDCGDSPERERQLVQQFVHVVNNHMKEIAAKLKIEKPITSYYARHSFNTSALRGGIPLQMISKQMGHSNLATTEGYFAGFEDESIRQITDVLTAFKTKPAKLRKIKTAL